MDKPLRISRLTEENFMRIRSLDIQPGHKTLVLLRGPNENGKTSAIRALISALGGKSFDPDTPIRNGEDNAIVDVVLADDVSDRLRATVSWTPKGRYLTVRQLGQDGETKLSAGQTVLDALVGALAFDPLVFMREKPAEQLAMLMTAIGKQTAYEQIQQRRAQFFERRTIVNRLLKEAKVAAQQKPDPSPAAELKEKPLADIQTTLQTAQQKHREAAEYGAKLVAFKDQTNRLIENRERMWEELAKLEAHVAELKGAIGDAARVIEERIGKYQAGLKRHMAMAEALPATDDTTRQIAELQAHNDRVRLQREARQLASKVTEHERDAEHLTQSLASLDAEVRALLNTSDIGQRIPGLAVNEAGEITHNGLPIGQASGMRQLELSCLVGMVSHRQLRAMCIDEGDRLDPASLQRLKEIAQQHQYQVWMTTIYAGNGDDLEHVVELYDGQAKGQPATVKPPPPKPKGETVSDDGTDELYRDPRVQQHMRPKAGPASQPVADLDHLEL